MPIWKPFIDWMAAWALPGLSKLTNPGGKAKRERKTKEEILLYEEAKAVWDTKNMECEDEFIKIR